MGISIMKDFGKIMTLKMFCVALLMFSVFDAIAYQFTLEGTVGGKYPIVIEVDRTSNGAIMGRYAYKSTLNKLGRNSNSSWLYIKPDGNSNRKYIITDANGKVEEHWDIIMSRRNGVNILEGSLINAKEKRFTVEAKSASNSHSSGLLAVLMKLCNMSYSHAMNYVMTNGFTHIKTFKKYYHDSTEDPNKYLGTFSQFSNGSLSVYFNTDNNNFSVWIDSNKDFNSLLAELKNKGYAIVVKESVLGTVGESYVCKNDTSTINIWAGGGWFDGYSVSVE